MQAEASNIPTARRGAWAVALLILGADLAAYHFLFRNSPNQYAFRLLGAIPLVYLVVAARMATPEALGLGRAQVWEEVKYAVKVGLIVCVAMAAVVIVALAAIRLAGVRPTLPPSDFEHTAEFYPYLLHACVMAPIVEEFIYRGIFVGLAAPAWGRRAMIAVSAVVFLGLHVVYQLPSILHPIGWIEYTIAGALLTWVFLKRGSLIPVMILHALGNLTVGAQNYVLLKWPQLPEWLLGM